VMKRLRGRGRTPPMGGVARLRNQPRGFEENVV
jgi:hypothetical protein